MSRQTPEEWRDEMLQGQANGAQRIAAALEFFVFAVKAVATAVQQSNEFQQDAPQAVKDAVKAIAEHEA